MSHQIQEVLNFLGQFQDLSQKSIGGILNPADESSDISDFTFKNKKGALIISHKERINEKGLKIIQS